MRTNSSEAGASTRTEGRRSRAGVRYRVGAVLVLLALIPLVGAGWFALGELRATTQERDRAAAVDAWVERLVSLSALRAGIFDELRWQAADRDLVDIGLDARLVTTATGVDVLQKRADAVEDVDELASALGLPAVAEQLVEVRADRERNIIEIGAMYRGIEAHVGRAADEALDELTSIGGDIEGGGELTGSLQALDAAMRARQGFAEEITSFFSAQFLDREDRGDQMVILVAADAVRARGLTEVGRLVAPDSRTRHALETITGSPADAQFQATATAYATEVFATGGTEDAVTLDVLLADIDGLAAAFAAASDAEGGYDALVAAAGDAVLAAGRGVVGAADQRTREALITSVVLAFCSLVSVAIATRLISAPIQRLAESAERVRDGRGAGPPAQHRGGPVEIQAAARAIDEAAAHLAYAERQATALAEGDLDEVTHDAPTGGMLGASLQRAVRTLAASIQEREVLRERMTHEATHDGLTGLANRNASLEHLHAALARTRRSGAGLAVLFIDLDGFKDVNDRRGHSAGDAVLRVTAARLAATVRDGDHVGRLGGDEFVVVAEPVDGIDDAAGLARRIRDAVCAPIAVDDTTVSVDASVGVALASAGDGADELLRDADLAVYKAKEDGRGRVEVCDQALRSRTRKQIDEERALRNAVVDGELVLHYQLIVDPADGSRRGLEAFVRWDRPDRGLVPPNEFLPVAERSDLAIALDTWVLRAVAHQIVSWDADGVLSGVPVAVNVSGRHLRSPAFVSNVVAPFDELGIDPGRLVVEVSENALFEDLDDAAAKLGELRARGVRTAIDDFGTGYSSLARLRELPIDILKVDRRFTSDAAAASLVQLIIDTGHFLGAVVTAEGIETEDQAEAVAAMGSDGAQGYLYGRPLAPAELARFEHTLDAAEDISE